MDKEKVSVDNASHQRRIGRDRERGKNRISFNDDEQYLESTELKAEIQRSLKLESTKLEARIDRA